VLNATRDCGQSGCAIALFGAGICERTLFIPGEEVAANTGAYAATDTRPTWLPPPRTGLVRA